LDAEGWGKGDGDDGVPTAASATGWGTVGGSLTHTTKLSPWQGSGVGAHGGGLTDSLLDAEGDPGVGSPHFAGLHGTVGGGSGRSSISGGGGGGGGGGRGSRTSGNSHTSTRGGYYGGTHFTADSLNRVT